MTPDGHVACGFHEILLHDMGEEELRFVATSELDYLRRIWPRALFAFMTRYQQQAEGMQGTVWLYTIRKLYTLW